MKRLKTFFQKIKAWIVPRLQKAKTWLVAILQKAKSWIVARSQKIGSWIIAHKVRFFLIAGVLAATVILLLDYLFLEASNKADVIVEAHGMLFDIILFGIILTVYESYLDRKNKKEQVEKDKKNRIARYKEELGDYRRWKGEEASFRVAGLVNRLLKEGVKDIDLDQLHVGQFPQLLGEKGIELIKESLRSGKFIGSIEGAHLHGEDLSGFALHFSTLKNASLSNTNLEGTVLFAANLEGADLQNAKLKGAYLNLASLENANLHEADLQGARAFQFQREEFSNVLTVEQLDSMIWMELGESLTQDNEVETQQVQKEKLTCTGIKKNGEPCNSPPKKGQDRCHHHPKDEKEND